MNKDETHIIGFVPANEGWYVLDHDIEERVVYKMVITGWVFTQDQLALPVSPECPMRNMNTTSAMMEPNGRIFNRSGQEWSDLLSYKAANDLR